MKYEIRLSAKEAINILKNDFKDCPEFCSLNDCDLCCAEATKMAIEALEKQIPKPIVRHGYVKGELCKVSFVCPECDKHVSFDDNFCKNCGQRLTQEGWK